MGSRQEGQRRQAGWKMQGRAEGRGAGGEGDMCRRKVIGNKGGKQSREKEQGKKKRKLPRTDGRITDKEGDAKGVAGVTGAIREMCWE